MSAPARQMLGWLENAERRRLVRIEDLRPEYAETLDLPDRIGRKQPHRMGALTYATLDAQSGVGIKEVPGDFWGLTVTDDGFPAAEVACPCGGTPLAEALGPFAPCPGECGRHFFFDGDNVWAFNSPTKTELVPDVEPEA